MPRSTRFFPVNHDINADPEVWELTDKFGDRALRVWLEILSIADRNRGEIPGRWETYPSILAGRTKSTTKHLQAVCQWVTRWLVVDSEGVARVRNYPKYHKTRGGNRDSPNLTKPNLTKPNKEEEYIKSADAPKPKATLLPENFVISERLTTWCVSQETTAEAHLDAFQDHHKAKGSKFIDWDAAFRTWVRNSARFGRPTLVKPETQEERLKRALTRGL